jgi:hypothetical protein
VPIAARPCPADFDHSGSLGIADIIAFTNAWLAANSRADADHSGTIDATDIFDFLTAWFSGCP